ncbi:hypothetical protein GCM10012283_28420 [Phycicoccus endophyticus]|nr:hypothetical protein GCM10012283_28420 [Phycicoccus endophyticus]
MVLVPVRVGELDHPPQEVHGRCRPETSEHPCGLAVDRNDGRVDLGHESLLRVASLGPTRIAHAGKGFADTVGTVPPGRRAPVPDVGDRARARRQVSTMPAWEG